MGDLAALSGEGHGRIDRKGDDLSGRDRGRDSCQRPGESVRRAPVEKECPSRVWVAPRFGGPTAFVSARTTPLYSNRGIAAGVARGYGSGVSHAGGQRNPRRSDHGREYVIEVDSGGDDRTRDLHVVQRAQILGFDPVRVALALGVDVRLIERASSHNDPGT